MKVPVSITINGRRYQRDVEPRLLLVHFIRDLGGVTGTADLGEDILGDIYASAESRRAVAPVWVKRALTAAAARVA